MTPEEFQSARRGLGLSAREIGLVLGLQGDPGRTVRRYESGDIVISGPVQTAMRYILRHGLDDVARTAIDASKASRQERESGV